ncbi:lysophospholipase, partial [Klebsiella pneumoniae]|nr:lysophospholipase [Klebsiella pneumoniae]
TLYPERDELPYIVLGHSMGSIIARKYVEMYPVMSQGLILTGTGLFPKLKGKILTLLMKNNHDCIWQTQKTQMGQPSSFQTIHSRNSERAN